MRDTIVLKCSWECLRDAYMNPWLKGYYLSRITRDKEDHTYTLIYEKEKETEEKEG